MANEGNSERSKNQMKSTPVFSARLSCALRTDPVLSEQVEPGSTFW